jgi:hypothetical protein
MMSVSQTSRRTIMRILVGALVGAVLLMVWNFASWMLVGLHDESVRQLPAEGAVVTALKAAGPETGAYFFPYVDPDAPAEDAEAAMEKHKAGPVVFIAYDADGSEPMSPKVFGIGFALYLGATLFASILLFGARIKHAIGRVLFVASFGVIISLIGDLGYWNWMNFPTDFVLAMVVDHLVGWSLVGIALALIVRPRPEVAAA